MDTETKKILNKAYKEYGTMSATYIKRKFKMHNDSALALLYEFKKCKRIPLKKKTKGLSVGKYPKLFCDNPFSRKRVSIFDLQ